MVTSRVRVLAASGCLLAVLVAGCGSSDPSGDGTSTNPPPPTQTAQGSGSMPDQTSASVPVASGTARPDPEVTGTATSGATTPGGGTAGPDGTIDPALQTVVDRAVAELAGRVGVDPSVIFTVSAIAVTWPDRSIGCPKPGINYAQVTVDGAQVVLSAEDKLYDYHSGDDGKPVLCEKSFAATNISADPPTS